MLFTLKNQSDAPHLMIRLHELGKKPLQELLALARSLSVENPESLQRQGLTFAVLKKKAEKEEAIIADGVVEILPDGFGFLRSTSANYLPSPNDVYISSQQVRTFHLKTGDVVEGMLKAPKEPENYCSLTKLLSINMRPPEEAYHRVPFDHLTPIFPTRKLCLETPIPNPSDSTSLRKDMTLRVVDLVAPIGFGQRGLIVAPPRTGKTVVLQAIIKTVMANHPGAILIVLLIDERPEEVTEMVRLVKCGEVISSTFDEPATRHVQVAEMVLEKAKRLVEAKKDVVIILDSITRLARAYNTVVPSSGKVLTGGVDANALQKPKRFFGAARNVEEGGSLTIIGSALVDTGSRMDEVIFEEFKGTGNSELILDRKLADRGIFPAIDLTKSGTRRVELLVEPPVLMKLQVLRRVLSPMGSQEGMEFLLEKLSHTKDNNDFFQNMNR